MNIFETFELFLRRPMSILRHGLVSIVHVKVENIFAQKAINADLTDSGTQITVVNNEKVYNLLKTVMYRVEKRRMKEMISDNNPLKTETLLEINE